MPANIHQQQSSTRGSKLTRSALQPPFPTPNAVGIPSCKSLCHGVGFLVEAAPPPTVKQSNQNGYCHKIAASMLRACDAGHMGVSQPPCAFAPCESCSWKPPFEPSNKTLALFQGKPHRPPARTPRGCAHPSPACLGNPLLARVATAKVRPLGPLPQGGTSGEKAEAAADFSGASH